eukprot:jgi/Psemu1/328905/estExt_fgenesh1_pg.C_29730002
MEGNNSSDEIIRSASTSTSTVPTTTTTTTTTGSVTLLIENPGKGKNWGPLLRCCAAFGIGTIFVVGYDQCDVRGSHGASKHVQLRAFPTHEQAARALQSAAAVNDGNDNGNGNEDHEGGGGGGGGFELIGLLAPYPNQEDGWDDDENETLAVIRETFLHQPTQETTHAAEVVRTAPPASSSSSGGKDCCIDDENEHESKHETDKMRRGLPWSLAKHCTSFVHIPHANYQPCSGGGGGGVGGSMLTLEASVSIIFHELLSRGDRSGYTEEESSSGCGTIPAAGNTVHSLSDYNGQKYHVEKVHKGGNPNDEQARQRKRKEREEKLKELQDEADDIQQQQQLLFGAGNDLHADGDY